MNSDNCKCIFIPGEEVPLIIQKSDGGYTYDSTDMAAIEFRFNELKVDQALYLTDMGQRDHFSKIFKAAEISNFYNPESQTATHIGFGLILGEDGGKMKSRSGESVKLNELLNEGTERALTLLKERLELPKVSGHLKGRNLEQIAETISVNSIKYFDLKQSRASTYKFSFESMLDTKGNTGVYITYMYVRICSILAKAKPQFSNENEVHAEIQDYVNSNPE